jgi:sialic acid synthase SpsE
MKAGAVLELGARTVGEGQPCFVLACVGQAHGGSADAALRMIEAAFKMGADGIVFDVFRSEHVVVRRHPERGSLDEVELRPRDWKRVLGEATASGLAVVVEALDAPSLELAAEAEVHGFQVHGSDMENPEFIRAVGACGRPVLLAVGGVPDAAVREATDALVGAPAGIVHGFPAAPAPPEELCFRGIEAWKERYRLPVGFLDLTDGGSAFALVAPAVASARGADFVEKPFTLDRSRKGHDYRPSLSPEDFYRMVELLRQAELAAGETPRGESDGAVRSRQRVARSIVAGALIPRGEVLTAPMLAYKRTDARYEPGFAPREAHRVIGRRAARPIQADETIREDMLE